MGKDPAILWYWNDWHGKTVTLSRFLKGCYMDLLHAQFNNGRLSLEDIKIVLGTDLVAAWPTLQKKFTVDEAGKYFNERIEHEKEKRAKFKEKQSINGKKGGRPPNNPNKTQPLTQIKPIIEDEIEIGNGFYCDRIDKDSTLTEVQIGATIEFVAIKTKVRLRPSEVSQHWDAFKIIQFSRHEWYNGFEDLLSHFRNSLKKDLQSGVKLSVPKEPEKPRSLRNIDDVIKQMQ